MFYDASKKIILLKQLSNLPLEVVNPFYTTEFLQKPLYISFHIKNSMFSFMMIILMLYLTKGIQFDNLNPQNLMQSMISTDAANTYKKPIIKP